jgi:hypothetical protein
MSISKARRRCTAGRCRQTPGSHSEISHETVWHVCGSRQFHRREKSGDGPITAPATELYDRRHDQVTLDQVERIVL